VRLALKVFMQNDGDFVNVILVYPLIKRLGVPHIRSGRFEEQNICPYLVLNQDISYVQPDA
jgi:hypothetical protein